MARPRFNRAACIALAVAAAAWGCQKQVVSGDFRPSTGMPVSQSLPYHKPNIPMDLVSPRGAGGPVMPEGMKSLSNWHQQHHAHSGPKFRPQTIGPPGSD